MPSGGRHGSPVNELTAANRSKQGAVVFRKGVTMSKLREAQQVIKERVLAKCGSFHAAFKRIDADRTGTLSREEIKSLLTQLNAYGVNATSSLTSEPVSEDTVEVLMDLVDVDRDGSINYEEFSRLLMADDVMSLAAWESMVVEAHPSDGLSPAAVDAMEAMRQYCERHDIDIIQAMQGAGNVHGGLMPKNKFSSAISTAFHRLGVSDALLLELEEFYGGGGEDRNEGGYKMVRWRDFACDVAGVARANGSSPNMLVTRHFPLG